MRLIVDAQLIREARERIGLTQRQLAEQVDASRHRLSDWERGVYGPDNAHTLALFRALDDEFRCAVCEALLASDHGDVIKFVIAYHAGSSVSAAAITRSRKRLGWDTIRLAEHLEVCVDTVRKWERGASRPAPGYVWRLQRFILDSLRAEMETSS